MAVKRLFSLDSRNDVQPTKLSPGGPQAFVDKLLIIFLLDTCNDEKSSNGAVSSRPLLTTMKAQQAVAIRFVGRRVIDFDVPFF